jgi:AraC-like DNA-binding protein
MHRSIRVDPGGKMLRSRLQQRDLATEARDIVRREYGSPDGCGTSNIAHRLGISPSALCHRYRLAFHSTIGRDVRRLRIEEARRLLRLQPDRLLKEVAAEVGYVHSAYRTFLNAFRAETGVSPTTYIEAIRARRLNPFRVAPPTASPRRRATG